VSPPVRFTRWLGDRSARERMLLAIATGLSVAAALTTAVLAGRDDIAALRARVVAHERELDQVRRLAATLRRQTSSEAPPDVPSLLTRLEAAADEAVGRQRIASMTPAGEGPRSDRLALRVAGASLAEVVRLLHGLESGSPAIPVARLELRKHPDDRARFDATIEVGAP
jgi:hypothetical protein